MLKRILLAVVVLVAIPGLSDSATLYVDRVNGNDSTTYAANGPSAPWATIGRAAWGSTNRSAPNAAEAAKAGDTVIVRAGTYTTVGTNSRYIPAYNPVNSGAAGTPITFQADGVVTLIYSSGVGPVIGAYERSYITWRGFTVDEALAPAATDTGPVVLWVAVGCVIEYCDIDGNGVPPWGSGELHNGVRINAGGGNTVRYNYIHDVHQASGSNSNASAILVDQSDGGLVEHNEIANCDGVFFIKRNFNQPSRWIVRYNYGHDSGMGIRADQLQLVSPFSASNTADFYQNLLVNIRESAFATNHYESRETHNIRIVNNTIKNCGRAFEGSNLTTDAGHVFWNNIVADSPLAFRSYDYPALWTLTTLDAEHNMYHGMTNAALFRWELTGQTTLSFADWRALGQDHVTPDSQEADPLFVNEVGGDYRLQAGSPARNAGVDRLDLNGNGSTSDLIPIGAYVTGSEVIGRGPSAPRGVIIR